MDGDWAIFKPIPYGPETRWGDFFTAATYFLLKRPVIQIENHRMQMPIEPFLKYRDASIWRPLAFVSPPSAESLGKDHVTILLQPYREFVVHFKGGSVIRSAEMAHPPPRTSPPT